MKPGKATAPVPLPRPDVGCACVEYRYTHSRWRGQSTSGWVYLHGRTDGVVKIGKTRADPEARRVKSERVYGLKLRSVHVMSTNLPLVLETLLHRSLSAYRESFGRGREWFAVPPTVLAVIKSAPHVCFAHDADAPMSADRFFAALCRMEGVGEPGPILWDPFMSEVRR